MPALSDYTAGTITLTNGSVNFTGSGTGWQAADFREGDTILGIEDHAGVEYVIASITGNGAGTLTQEWEGATGIYAYRMRYMADGARVTAQARNLIELLGNGNIQALAGLTGPGVPVFNGLHSMTLKPEADFGNVVGPSGAVGDRIAVFDGTTGKLIKDGGVTIGQLELDRKTVANLLADTVFSYSAVTGKTLVEPGQIITAGGFRYEVAASSASDEHEETAGGVKLYEAGPTFTHIDRLRRVAGSAGLPATLTQDGRGGTFKWYDGDLSRFVSIDVSMGMYVPPISDNTGASGAWVRHRDNLDLMATWFGAVPDSTGVGSGTNSQPAIQAALNLAISQGGNLNLGWGNFRLSSGLVYNKTTLNADSGKVPSIYGAGITQTRLYFDAGVSIGLDVQGAFVAGIFGSFFHLHDFGIFSSGKTGTGLKVKDVALADFSRIRANGWNKGVHFQNVISIKFDHPYLDSNVYGLHAEDGPSAAPCNAINIVSPWIGSNDRVGVLADNPATLNIYGGSIEGNGLVTGGVDPNSSGGLIITNPGEGGHNSVVVQGVYFEHNKGIADILIYSTLYSVSHYIHGNSFSRISATDYTTQNIFIIADAVAQTLSLSGNGFGNLSSAYIESAARPYVKIDDANNVLTVVDDGSNTYENAIAAPNFSAIYALTPKTNAQAVGWVSATGVLSAGSSNISSVSRVSAGRYKINLKKGWVGPKFAATMPNLGRTCALFTYDDTSLTIEFQTIGGSPAAADVDFGFAVYKPV